VITGAPTPPGQLYPNETMLTLSRVVEACFELAPQAVLQAYIILQSTTVTPLQLWAFFLSCFCTGFILSNASYDMDCSPKYRAVEPSCYGMYPVQDRLRSLAIFAGETLFITGYTAVRVLAVATALAATGMPRGVVPAWVAAEFALYLGAKWADGAGRYWLRGMSGAFPSLLMSLTQFFLLQVAPFTWIRHPFNVSPHLYASFLVLTMASSAAMCAAAYAVAGAHGAAALGALALSRGGAARVLGGCALLSATGFALLWARVRPEFRPTFYRRKTMRQHVAMLWESCTMINVVKYGPTRDDARARTLAVFSPHLWPARAHVRAWAWEHWDAWQTDVPLWFTEKWRGLFPDGFLPPLRPGFKDRSLADKSMAHARRTFRIRTMNAEKHTIEQPVSMLHVHNRNTWDGDTDNAEIKVNAPARSGTTVQHPLP